MTDQHKATHAMKMIHDFKTFQKFKIKKVSWDFAFLQNHIKMFCLPFKVIKAAKLTVRVKTYF